MSRELYASLLSPSGKARTRQTNASETDFVPHPGFASVSLTWLVAQVLVTGIIQSNGDSSGMIFRRQHLLSWNA